MENLSFNDIPIGIRTPGQYIEIDNSRAVRGLPEQDRKLLIVGQRLPTGSVAELVPTRVLNDDAAEDYAGRGSQLSAMLQAALSANPRGDIWMIAKDDLPAGNQATGSITAGGAITGSGTLDLLIAGIEVRVGVVSGQTAAEVAANIVLAITEKDVLPVTAEVNGTIPEQVDLTARHKGECGNDIDLRANYWQGQALPAGMTLSMIAMTGGTGNPDADDVITIMGDDQYYSMVTPWTDAPNMLRFEDEMSDRFGPMEQLTGHLFAAISGTHGEMSTYGTARNSPHSTVIGAYDSPTAPWIWAATLAATCDRFGSIDPARPFQTLHLPDLLPPPEEFRFNRTERDLLLHDGITTYLIDAGGRCLIEHVITTYQKNAFGIDDDSYLNLNTIWTVDYIRYAVRARIGLKFPRMKLADDGTRFSPGQAIVTPSIIRLELIALFRELEFAGFVENVDEFIDELIVVRSESDRDRVNAIIPPDIINQFRVFAAAVQFKL